MPDTTQPIDDPRQASRDGVGSNCQADAAKSRARANDDAPRRTRHKTQKRRGVSGMWLVLTMPVVMSMMGIVVETGNLWLARIELRTALEAAALAGVDEWGDLGDNSDANRFAARLTAVELSEANLIVGQLCPLSANAGGPSPNNNATIQGNTVILGAYDLATRRFNASLDPEAAGYDRAVHVQATMSVDSIIGNYFGVEYDAFDISTQATARYNSGSPVVVRIDSFAP